MSLLVVSPHPDDETLGAGGTILKYKNNGQKIYWLNFTHMKEEYGYEIPQINKRNNQIDAVNKLYGFDKFYNLELEPAYLEKYHTDIIIRQVSSIINEIKPQTVILPYRYDIHSDHKFVFDVMYSCTKNFRYPYIKKILCMEILSETDFSLSDCGFVPNYFVDITEFMDKKIQISKTYEGEIKDHPFPRSELSIKSLASIRGCSCGCFYAEGFKLIKYIE